MLKGDDIKRLVKEAENWQLEFKLAKGGVSGEKVLKKG